MLIVLLLKRQLLLDRESEVKLLEVSDLRRIVDRNRLHLGTRHRKITHRSGGDQRTEGDRLAHDLRLKAVDRVLLGLDLIDIRFTDQPSVARCIALDTQRESVGLVVRDMLLLHRDSHDRIAHRIEHARLCKCLYRLKDRCAVRSERRIRDDHVVLAAFLPLCAAAVETFALLGTSRFCSLGIAAIHGLCADGLCAVFRRTTACTALEAARLVVIVVAQLRVTAPCVQANTAVIVAIIAVIDGDHVRGFFSLVLSVSDARLFLDLVFDVHTESAQHLRFGHRHLDDAPVHVINGCRDTGLRHDRFRMDQVKRDLTRRAVRVARGVPLAAPNCRAVDRHHALQRVVEDFCIHAVDLVAQHVLDQIGKRLVLFALCRDFGHRDRGGDLRLDDLTYDVAQHRCLIYLVAVKHRCDVFVIARIKTIHFGIIVMCVFVGNLTRRKPLAPQLQLLFVFLHVFPLCFGLAPFFDQIAAHILICRFVILPHVLCPCRVVSVVPLIGYRLLLAADGKCNGK